MMTMPNAQALEFIRKVEQDQELSALVRGVSTDDRARALAELVRIARRAGYELSPAALEAALADCAPRELSDDDLQAAAGGKQYAQTDWEFIGQRTSPFAGFFSAPKS